jgi:lysophospholipase L1-like esterase
MRGINILLAIGISLLLAFAVFEGGLRIFTQLGPKPTINEFHSKLGWAKKPGVEVDRSTPEFDVTFAINELGLRDDPMASPAKPDGVQRVLMLGDSFVLGYTVDRHHLFVDQLEDWWQAEGRDVDVINAGTEGYSTDQEVLWFLEQGVDFAPDLVVLFPYENDLYWNGQASYTRFPKPRFGADGTLQTGTLLDPGGAPALASFATIQLLGAALSLLGDGPTAHHFQPAGSDRMLFNEWGPLLHDEPAFLADALARTRGALQALATRCDEIGVRLVVAPIPSESVVHPEHREAFRTSADGLKGLPDDAWDPNRPVDLFLGMARDLGITNLDARAALIEAGADEPLYFDVEWHFNPRGNEVFARFLHAELDRLDVLPAAVTSADLVVAEEEAGIPTWMFVFGTLWLILGTCFSLTYRDEPPPLAFLKVGVLLSMVFALILSGAWVLSLYPSLGPKLALLAVAAILGFVAYKLGRRVGTIAELLRAFTLRGHWYLMPLVVVLLTIGSLLVVAASSPLVAPFIYTLF